MSGVGEAFAGGVAVPILQPIIRWFDMRVNRRQQVARLAPALVLNFRTYNCDHLEDWLAQADGLLRTDRWLKQEFWNREVHLRRIASALVAHDYWREADAWHFDGRSIEVLGPHSPRKRLAIVLWAAREGILRRPEDSGGESSSAAGSRTQQVDVAIDVQSQTSLGGGTETVGTLSSPMDGFSISSPEPGIPISISKVILPLTIDIRKRPTPTLMISERAFRDLGALMYDRRGAFEIEVQCSLSRSLGDIVEAVNTEVLDGARVFEVALLDTVESAVHDRICYNVDTHYKRPVRPSDWPFKRDLHSLIRLENKWCFDNKKDGRVVRVVNPQRELGKVSVNINAELCSEVLWAIKALKLIGCPVEYAKHEFGLLWIPASSYDLVILGKVELTDARQYAEKWTSSDSSGRNDTGDRWLALWGWHNGPDVFEGAEGWLIWLFDQDKGTIPEWVGYGVLDVLPLNLC